MMRDMVVLINLDGTACRSMARKLRAEHIYCKILPAASTAADVMAQDALGIILAGASTGEKAAIPCLDELVTCGLPVLGMGDAALTLCEGLGGTLGEKAREPGVVQVRFEGEDPLVEGVEASERYLPALRCMILGEERAMALAKTDDGMIGFRRVDAPVYGLAFLPEQNDQEGVQLLLNFCRSVCGCTLWWSNKAFLERAQEEIERAAGDGEAICALSGGVDSGVCALLGNMALGHRLHCIFVDTGLLRKDEGDQVMAVFREQLGLNLQRINASGEFMAALRGITDRAQKERVILRLLRSIVAREVAARPGVRLLIKGTNYADALEMGERADAIDAAAFGVRVVEPVRELFKDEIRRVGEELQLPASVIGRQPFPSSGLALRIEGEVTADALAVLRDADAIFSAEVEGDRQGKRLHQYYATLSGPANRCCVTLHAVQRTEGSAAVAARLPYDLLERVTQAIQTRQSSVVSVLYDLSPGG